MTLPIIPVPLSARRGEGSVPLSPQMPILLSDESLRPVVTRFLADLHSDGGVPLLPVLTSADEAAFSDVPTGTTLCRISLVTADPVLDTIPPTTGIRADHGEPDDERHALSVSPEGIHLRAHTTEGIFRALTTLRQLLAAAATRARAEGSAQLALEEVHILDSPRFAWRGLSLDVARAPHSSEQVRRTLDMLALHKMNVLHLHLTDDQGWRLPVPAWPRLALSQPDGTEFTPEEIHALVTYARDRFITIVPEVDMPGHCGAAVAAYPELSDGSAKNLLTPDHELTWQFVRDVLARTAELFTDSRFLHVGADEAFGMADADHARFVSRVRTIVSDLGRRTIGWQEIARGELEPRDLIQYWIEDDFLDQLDFDSALLKGLPEQMKASLVETFSKAAGDLPAALSQGAGVIVSPMSSMYLDHPYEESSLDPADESARERLGMPVYAPLSVRDAYEAAVSAFVGPLASPEVVAGVEAAIWCESVEDGEDLEFLLLPRLAGIAEVAWSAPEMTGWERYRTRLARVATIWASREWRWFRSAAIEWEAGGHR